MTTEWKTFRASTRDECTCGPAAELHVMFAPKLVVGAAGAIAAAIAYGFRGSSNVYAVVTALAAVGAVVALLSAVYIHYHCTRCGRIARTESGKERSVLMLIRAGCLVTMVILGAVTVYSANHLAHEVDAADDLSAAPMRR